MTNQLRMLQRQKNTLSLLKKSETKQNKKQKNEIPFISLHVVPLSLFLCFLLVLGLFNLESRAFFALFFFVFNVKNLSDIGNHMRQLGRHLKFLLVFFNTGIQLFGFLSNSRDLLLGFAHLRLQVSGGGDQIGIGHTSKFVHWLKSTNRSLDFG